MTFTLLSGDIRCHSSAAAEANDTPRRRTRRGRDHEEPERRARRRNAEAGQRARWHIVHELRDDKAVLRLSKDELAHVGAQPLEDACRVQREAELEAECAGMHTSVSLSCSGP